MSRAPRPTVRPCHGRSPLTGRRVGERHRWVGGWGRGACIFCHKFLEDVQRRPAPAEPPTIWSLADAVRAKAKLLATAGADRERELLIRAIDETLTRLTLLAAGHHPET